MKRDGGPDMLGISGVARMLGHASPRPIVKQPPKKRRWVIEVEVIDSPPDKDHYLGRKDVVAMLNFAMKGGEDPGGQEQAQLRILAVRQEGVVK